MQALTLALDLGGTNVRAGLVDSRHRLLKRAALPSRVSRGVDAVVDDIDRLGREVAGRHWSKVRACGISAPGPLDARRTRILFAPNMPGWRKVPLPALLNRRWKKPVHMENDANCAALGEAIAGAGKKYSSVALYILGTGVGGGIVLNGSLLIGATGVAAELGHVILDPAGRPCGCGRRGCLEAYASGTSIAKRYRTLGGTAGRTTRELFARPDRRARQAIDEALDALAIGIANLVTTLNPDLILLAGGVSLAGSKVTAPLRRRVAAHLRPLGIRPPGIRTAALGDNAGLIGAAAIAQKRRSRR